MNFLQYKDAYDMMQQTGLSAPECLRIINNELENVRRKIRVTYGDPDGIKGQ
jgi:hypothetical protein